MPYTNNKGADQTVQSCSLISALLFPVKKVTGISSYFILYIDLIHSSGALWYFFPTYMSSKQSRKKQPTLHFISSAGYIYVTSVITSHQDNMSV